MCRSAVLDGICNGRVAHCVFRFVRPNYTRISVRNGSLRPTSSAGSLVLASPTCKSHSRNACSSVLGRLGANPARRQAYAPPALRLCSWVTSQWGQWLRSPTAEVTLWSKPAVSLTSPTTFQSGTILSGMVTRRPIRVYSNIGPQLAAKRPAVSWSRSTTRTRRRLAVVRGTRGQPQRRTLRHECLRLGPGWPAGGTQ